MKKILAVIILLTTVINASVYHIENKKSVVSFTATKIFFVDVVGTFKDFKGVIITNNSDEITFVGGKIEVNTIFTDNSTRDNHLRSDSYFDANQFPIIEFKSNSIDDKIIGNLTMRGITKQVVFKIENKQVNDNQAELVFTGIIDRKLWKIDNDFMSSVIKNNVDIKVYLKAKR